VTPALRQKSGQPFGQVVPRRPARRREIAALVWLRQHAFSQTYNQE
jgi:hypothetical protein